MGTAEYGRGMKSVKGYKLIAEKAEKIKSIEWIGAPYVEDGDGARYNVTMGDGSKHEVEFYDYFDHESGMDESQEGEEVPQENRIIDVIWDGAVDYSDSYDDNDMRSYARVKRDLIKRYGKLARAWLE